MRSSSITTGLLVSLAAGLGLSGLHAATAASDCTGLPYGTEGCPIHEEIAESIDPLLCGNGAADPGEECDLGRFNGLSNCTKECNILFCGDGVVSGYIGEECEPETEEIYTIDPETGKLATEITYIEQTCGVTCTSPVCDTEECTGGCKVEFLGACTYELRERHREKINTGTGSSSTGQTIEQTDVLEEVVLESLPINDVNPSIEPLHAAPSEQKKPDEIREIVQEVENTIEFSITPRCGNGVVEQGEMCDDGNQINTDACSNICRAAACGDGIIQSGEECDDANKINTDQCTNYCRQSICGDAIVQQGEECDDGNRINNDLCPNDCLLAVCGDGIREGLEQCDDGNAGNQDNCPTSCKLALCGNGIIEGIEECDDGNRVSGDGCGVNCTRDSVCGNAIREGGEECDHGLKNSDDKPDSCRLTCHMPYCGDGVIDAGEECDSQENCTAKCHLVKESAPEKDYTLIYSILLMISGAGMTVICINRNKILGAFRRNPIDQI